MASCSGKVGTLPNTQSLKPITYGFGEWVGRSLVVRVITGGKSGLRRTGWSITSTGREARESATESRPPNGAFERAW